jgi:hypothetical protein
LGDAAGGGAGGAGAQVRSSPKDEESEFAEELGGAAAVKKETVAATTTTESAKVATLSQTSSSSSSSSSASASVSESTKETAASSTANLKTAHLNADQKLHNAWKIIHSKHFLMQNDGELSKILENIGLLDVGDLKNCDETNARAIASHLKVVPAKKFLSLLGFK